MNKLFIVTFTDQESWEEELEEKVASGQYGYFAQEIEETSIIGN